MNIAFDMFFAKTEAMKRGIGRYSQNLIEHILKQETSHSYFYFYPDVSNGAEHLKDQLQQFLYRNRIDLYHMMSPFNLFHLPAHQFQAYSDSMLNKAWFGYTRVAATLYDVIPLVLEKQYMNDFVRPIYMKVIDMIRSCDIIYAISETTKQDAVRLTGMDPTKISVIMGGYDPKFKQLPNFNAQDVKFRYGVTKPYVLSTGGDDPRKNLARLIDAFIAANRVLTNRYQIVIVYNSTADEKRNMLDQAARLGGEGSVVVTGYVPDVDLVGLYNGAELFAFPSLYEGFGLPIVEAMACGTPVLTSNNSSLVEISGESTYLVNPDDTSSITDGIVQLLTNPQRLSELSKKGMKQSEQYNWKLVAEKVMDGYEAVFRRKIAVFSAMHPFLPHTYGDLHEAILILTDRCEIDVYVEEVLEDGPVIDKDSPIVIHPHQEFESRKDQYDYIIYEIGNDDRFLFIAPYMTNMEKYPGIVITHGIDLHALTLNWTIEQNSIYSYYKVLEKEYGVGAHAKLDELLGGTTLPKQAPLNRYYLADAKAILVYHEHAAKQLAEQGYRNIIVAPAPGIPAVSRRSSSGSKFVISTFVTKDTICDPVALHVIKEMLDQGCHNITYKIVGPFDSKRATELQSLVFKLGLEKQIEFTGPLSLSRYKRLMRRTDVALFLRDPAEGELISALIATMASGIPTIVFDDASFNELPNELLIKLPPVDQDAETALLQVMLQLYHSKEERDAISAKAKKYMEDQHSTQNFADMLQEAVDRSTMAGDMPTVLWQIHQSPDGVPRIRS
ncbi:glycosyltransferase [Cohnella abietis]|nr:glycosyltransferase [Cohnella abietis]